MYDLIDNIINHVWNTSTGSNSTPQQALIIFLLSSKLS